MNIIFVQPPCCFTF